MLNQEVFRTLTPLTEGSSDMLLTCETHALIAQHAARDYGFEGN